MNSHICMFREIKGIISGQIICNPKACNNEQGRQENLWGPGQNYIWDPYGIIFKQQRLKTGEQYSKVLRIPLNQVLIPYTCPDVDWALLNFRLFLKLGPPSRFRAQSKSPPLPPPPPPPPPPLLVALTMNAFICWHFFLSILCFSK